MREDLEVMFKEEEQAHLSMKKDLEDKLEEREMRNQKLIQEMADLRGELDDTTKALKGARKEAAERITLFSTQGRGLAGIIIINNIFLFFFIFLLPGTYVSCVLFFHSLSTAYKMIKKN